MTMLYILCSGIHDPDINARVWFDNGGIHNEADGNQGSKGQVVQKEPESGSSYNERGRLELVEIGDRYEDRHVTNGEMKDKLGLQKDESSLDTLPADVDEYDDDGGELEVEKKAEITNSSEGSTRMPRLRGAIDTVQTIAGGVEDIPVLGKLAEQQGRSAHEMQLDEELSSVEDRNTAADDVEVDKSGDSQKTLVQKPRRTKKKRHVASVYILFFFQFNIDLIYYIYICFYT